MGAVDLARLEFALLAGIHFLFVLVTLGLGPVVAVLGTRWARAERRGAPQAAVLERATRFWGQLYLVNYALGIAAGIVLELQFGLHFPGLLHVAGEVFGAPLAIETLGAFFLESTLLGLWVFGWHAVPRRVHHLIFWGVVATGYASAFTVMVANGFLRRPVGYELTDDPARGGVAVITDPAALILNPAAVLSALHVLGACLTAGAFVLVGVSARHLRRGRGPGGPWGGRRPADIDEDLWRRSMRAGLVSGLIGQVLVHVFGFSQFTYRTELDPPASGDGGQGALHTLADVALGFMILGGGWILLGVVAGALLLIGDAVFRMPRPLRAVVHGVMIVSVPLPFLLSLLGWLTRELSRSPWVVHGVLHVDDAVSDQPTGAVLASLLVLVVLMLTLAVVDWVTLGRLAALGCDRLVLGAPPGEVLADETGPDDDELLRFAAPAAAAAPAGPPGPHAPVAPEAAR